MEIAVFDTHAYEREALSAANVRYRHQLTFLEPRLARETASLAVGFRAVCSFVNGCRGAGDAARWRNATDRASVGWLQPCRSG